jgi:hypothetical protein
MAKVTNIEEFRNEGFAIIEDTVGKYVVTKDSDNIFPIPAYDKQTIEAYFGRRTPCALLQSRQSMMT